MHVTSTFHFKPKEKMEVPWWTDTIDVLESLKLSFLQLFTQRLVDHDWQFSSVPLFARHRLGSILLSISEALSFAFARHHLAGVTRKLFTTCSMLVVTLLGTLTIAPQVISSLFPFISSSITMTTRRLARIVFIHIQRWTSGTPGSYYEPRTS